MKNTYFRKLRFFALLISALIMAALSVAEAKDQKATARSGRATVVANHYIYFKETCELGGLPQMKIRSAPKHGKVRFAKSIITMEKANSRCNGKKIKARQIIYQSRSGYRGTDTFTIDYAWVKNGWGRLGVTSTYKYVVTVK